jgi:hypothetical protein
MSDTLQPQIDSLQAQLHDAAVALGIAKQKGLDPAVIAQYQARFDALRTTVNDLVIQEGAAEAAPDFWSRVGDFQSAVASAARGVGTFIADLANAADKTVRAAGNTLSLLPLLVIGAAVLFGVLLYKGKLKLPGT